MASRANCPKPSRLPGVGLTGAGRLSRLSALAALGTLMLLPGCGSAVRAEHTPAPLIAGQRAGPIPSAQLAPAVGLARRFAIAYADVAYRRSPGHLPGATASVLAHLRLAARHVPAQRRGRRCWPTSIALAATSARTLAASVELSDGVNPRFGIAFTLTRARYSGWRVSDVFPPE